MSSLSDSTRIRLLSLLEREELGVAELCEILQLPQSTVSRHLKILSGQAWLQRRRQGTANLYRLNELEAGAAALWRLSREQLQDWMELTQDQQRLEEHLRSRRLNSFFARAALGWEGMRESLYGQSFLSVALSALLPPHWTLVDLGCGTGGLLSLLAPQLKQVIGVDRSEAMLRSAQHRTGAYKNIQLLQGELSDLPLPDACCEAVSLILSLCYLGDPAQALGEMRRILRPGGRAVIINLLPHDREELRRESGQKHRGFAQDEIERLLRGAGFDGSRCQALPPEPRAKGPALMLATAWLRQQSRRSR